jgi:hypothetical protein
MPEACARWWTAAVVSHADTSRQVCLGCAHPRAEPQAGLLHEPGSIGVPLLHALACTMVAWPCCAPLVPPGCWSTSSLGAARHMRSALHLQVQGQQLQLCWCSVWYT